MIVGCELDLATGVVFYDGRELFLPGPIAYSLSRRYRTDISTSGLFGYGSLTSAVTILQLDDKAVRIGDPIDDFRSWTRAQCDGVHGPRLEFIGNSALTIYYPDLSRQIFKLDSGSQDWYLLETSDAYRNSIVFDYAAGRPVNVRSSTGSEILLEYRGGLVQAINIAAGGRTLYFLHFEYDGAQNLVREHSPAGVTQFFYDGHLLVRTSDPRGAAVNYSYDSQRRCVRITRDSGILSRTIQYDDRRHRTLVIDSLGNKSVFYFNEAGARVRFADAAGNQTEFITDDDSRMIATVRPDGSTWMADHFEDGVLITYDEFHAPWKRRLDERGRLVEITSPTGLKSSFEYDAADNVVRQRMWNGAIVEYEYDAHGELARFTDPLGYSIYRDFNWETNRLILRDDLGLICRHQLDPLGNVALIEDASGRITRYEFINDDWLQREIQPHGGVESFTYDAVGNLTSITDPLGRVTQLAYDDIANVTALIHPDETRVSYEFDSEGSIVQIVDENGNRYRFAYSMIREPIEVISFDGIRTAYDLDALGRPAAIHDPEGTTAVGYIENTNVVNSLAFPTGITEQYVFTPDGELSDLVVQYPKELGGARRFAHVEVDVWGGETLINTGGEEIRYERDPVGWITAIEDSRKRRTSFTRDVRGRVSAIRDLDREFRVSHYGTGEMAEIGYPSGARQTFEFDAAGRMSRRSVFNNLGQETSRRDFAYDLAHQLLYCRDSISGVVEYAYDLRGRLTQVRRNGRPVEEYRFDAADNLISSPQFSSAVIAPGNRLVACDDEELVYDALGRLIERRGGNRWGYNWGHRDRLLSVTRDGELVGSYDYDVFGRRISKRVGNDTRTFLYQGHTLRSEHSESEGDWYFVSLLDIPVPIAAVGPQGEQIYGLDQLGTPTDVFDSNGNWIESIPRSAFGVTTARVGRPFGFMGQYIDDETGLHYSHFRYYAPWLARFISQDPLELNAGTNFYIYPTNPHMYADPLGLVMFFCNPKWSPCQKKYAKEKMDAVNNKPDSRKKCTKCRKDRQRKDFQSKRCGKGAVPSSYQVDHMHELQAGGPDRCCNNLRAIPKKFNNELGKRVKAMLKDVSRGALIGTVNTTGCKSEEPCSQADYDKLVKAPPGAANPCEPKHDQPVKQRC